MKMYDIRLESIHKCYKPSGGERRETTGQPGQTGQKGVEFCLPVQTELKDVFLIPFPAPAIADGGLMSFGPGVGV